MLKKNRNFLCDVLMKNVSDENVRIVSHVVLRQTRKDRRNSREDSAEAFNASVGRTLIIEVSLHRLCSTASSSLQKHLINEDASPTLLSSQKPRWWMLHQCLSCVLLLSNSNCLFPVKMNERKVSMKLKWKSDGKCFAIKFFADVVKLSAIKFAGHPTEKDEN